MDIVCTVLNPLLDLSQNLINVVFYFFSWFGFSAPDVASFVGGLFGCVA